MHLLLTHRVAGHRLLIVAHRLYVNTHGPIADGTNHRIAAMTEVKMDIRIVAQRRLAVWTIAEQRFLGDAIFFLQAFAQQQISRRTRLPPAFKTKAQRLFAPFVAEQRQRSLYVERIDVVVDVYHRREEDVKKECVAG